MWCSRLILPQRELNTVKFSHAGITVSLAVCWQVKYRLKNRQTRQNAGWNWSEMHGKSFAAHCLMQSSALEWCFGPTYNTRTHECCSCTVLISVQLTLRCYNRRDAVCLPNRPWNIIVTMPCVSFLLQGRLVPFAFSSWCGGCEFHEWSVTASFSLISAAASAAGEHRSHWLTGSFEGRFQRVLSSCMDSEMMQCFTCTCIWTHIYTQL